MILAFDSRILPPKTSKAVSSASSSRTSALATISLPATLANSSRSRSMMPMRELAATMAVMSSPPSSASAGLHVRSSICANAVTVRNGACKSWLTAYAKCSKSAFARTSSAACCFRLSSLVRSAPSRCRSAVMSREVTTKRSTLPDKSLIAAA